MSGGILPCGPQPGLQHLKLQVPGACAENCGRLKYSPTQASGDEALKIEKLHSHLNGHEWLLVHQPGIWKEIERVIGGTR